MTNKHHFLLKDTCFLIGKGISFINYLEISRDAHEDLRYLGGIWGPKPRQTENGKKNLILKYNRGENEDNILHSDLIPEYILYIFFILNIFIKII